MPAYIHDTDAERPSITCSKLCAPADVRNCGAEIKQTVIKPELLN